MCLGLCFLFSFSFFFFLFFLQPLGPETRLRPSFFLFFFFYHFILLTTIYRSLFQILKLQHPDDMSGTRKGSRHISSPVCLFFFLQSNFFLLKIIYIEITYGHMLQILLFAFTLSIRLLFTHVFLFVDICFWLYAYPFYKLLVILIWVISWLTFPMTHITLVTRIFNDSHYDLFFIITFLDSFCDSH